MVQHEQPQWQPISMLPMLADLLDEQLDEVQIVLDSLRQARSKPHVMDDYTIGRVIDSYSEQREFIMSIYPEQTARWRKAVKTATQRESVEQFGALFSKVVGQMDEAIALAKVLSAGTIDKILGMKDGELAEALMTGKMAFPDAPTGNEDLLAKERHQIANVLNIRMEALIEEACDDMEMLVGMQEYMPGFKHLMDTASGAELNQLLTEFPGLRRLVRLLETLAMKIQSGEIKVPK